MYNIHMDPLLTIPSLEMELLNQKLCAFII